MNVIGIFGQVEGDGEHSYGSVIELWKIGDEVIGFFNYYDGNVEADVGLITSGKISGDSIIIRGVLPEESDKEIFSVEGILQKNKITASLSLRQQKEEVQLHKNQDWNIKDYKYFREWKEDKKYVLRKFSLKRSK